MSAQEQEQAAQDIDPRKIGVLDDSLVDEERDEGEVRQFVSFCVGDSEYGVDIMAVREIKGWSDVTKLPNTAEFVRGVLNLRGVIVPIFDLRCRFGQGLTEASSLHVIIIVAVGDRIMGLLVDAVSDILTVNNVNILPVPEMEARSENRFLDGLVTVEERMVSVLDLRRLFDLEVVIEQLNSAKA